MNSHHYASKSETSICYLYVETNVYSLLTCYRYIQLIQHKKYSSIWLCRCEIFLNDSQQHTCAVKISFCIIYSHWHAGKLMKNNKNIFMADNLRGINILKQIFIFLSLLTTQMDYIQRMEFYSILIRLSTWKIWNKKSREATGK